MASWTSGAPARAASTASTTAGRAGGGGADPGGGARGPRGAPPAEPRRPSGHRVAAVDRDHLAGGPARQRRGRQHHRNDVVGTAEPAQRVLGEDLLHGSGI